MQRLAKIGGSIILITDPKNRQYLSGFDGSSGWLLLSGDQYFVLTDGRYWDQVERQCPGAELFRFLPDEHETLSQAVATLLKQENLLNKDQKLTIETDGVSLAVFRALTESLEQSCLEFKECSGLVSEQRECKDEEEISVLSMAANIADRAFAEALRDFHPGLRECDLKAELEYHILRLGGTSTSFSTIVASGPNGSYPHAGASERIINEGELITVDFGAVYQGYCSDMTRTIWYGKLGELEQNLLRQTREAQKVALQAVRPGVACSELDKTARDFLKHQNLDQYFVHSLGHGVGLDIHESPGLRRSTHSPLKIGHVITVEPGVYVPHKTGCRVEDTVVVTDSSYRLLNRFPKQALDSTAPSLVLLDPC
jgi:Xaa-Pro aminopeptidase